MIISKKDQEKARTDLELDEECPQCLEERRMMMKLKKKILEQNRVYKNHTKSEDLERFQSQQISLE